MTPATTLTFTVLLAVSLLHPAPANAQATWDPMGGVSKIVAWFSQLNEQMDKVIEKEKRAQLLRAVDRLRQDLYTLEGNAQILRDSVPDHAPSKDDREYLRQQSADLLDTVARLSRSVAAVGAELRLNDSADIEETLTYGLRTRAVVLTDFQEALQRSEAAVWDAKEIRKRLDVGIQAVKAAQLAATQFRRNAAKGK